jgi:hypothetical protein
MAMLRWLNAKDNFHYRLLVLATALNLIFLANYFLWIIGAIPNPVPATIIFMLLASTLFLARDIDSTWPLLLFFLFGCIVTLGVGTPSWDGRSIWLFHAKRIFLDDNLYAQLDNYAAPWSHNDYPVIFPALAATFAKLVGHWNDTFPKAIGLFFLVAPLIICLVALNHTLLFIVFLAGLLQICGTMLFNGYMDAILAVYTCAAVFCLMLFKLDNGDLVQGRYLNNYVSINWLWAAVVMAPLLSCIVLLKNEGVAIVVMLSSIAILYKRWHLLSFVVALSVYFFTWKIFLMSNDVPSDLFVTGVLARISKRLTNVYAAYQITLDIFRQSGVWFIAFCCVLFRKEVRWSQYRIPVLFLTMYIVLVFLVYLSTPYDLTWHLQNSTDRVFMPVNAVILGCVLLAFSSTVTKLRGSILTTNRSNDELKTFRWH